MAKYTETMQKNGLTEETVSHKIKKTIRDYHKMASAISEVEEELKGGDLSEAREEQLKANLTEWNETLEDMDNDLVKRIEYFVKHKDRLDIQQKKMRETLNAKKEGEPTPAAEPEEAPAAQEAAPVVAETVVQETPAPAAEETPATPEAPEAQEQPAPEETPVAVVEEPTTGPTIVKEEKKSRTPWGVLGFIGVVVAGALIGANIAKDK